MSKITYVVKNLLPNAFGIGSIGLLEANAQTSFLVEEDSTEDILINALSSKGQLSIVSAATLKTGGGTGADLTAAQVAVVARVSGDGVSGAVFPALESDLVLPFAKSGGFASQADETYLTMVRGSQSLAELACKQSTLPVRTVMVGASGTIAVGACAVVGIQAITLGTGSLTIHDDLNTAADATRLRFDRSVGAMVAGSYYPMVADDPVAMLFDKGAFVTVPTGGLYAVDLVDNRNLPGVEGAGLLCVPQRVVATGVAFYGRNSVVSVKVIAPGSAGSLSIYSNVNAADPLRLRFPVTAFGSLTADQIIRFGSRGCAASFVAMHVTVPTGGVVLINTLPR